MSDAENKADISEDQAEALFGPGSDAGQLDNRHHRRLLTMKTIEAHPERAFTLGRRIPLCLWKGIAHGVELTKSQETDQEFYALKGEFEAVVYKSDDADKYLDGDSVSWYGGLCFMPSGFHDAAMSRMSVMEPEALRDPGFVFALEFWAEPRSGKGTNYSYIAKPMQRRIAAHDRLSMLTLEAERVRQLRLRPPTIEHQPGAGIPTDAERAMVNRR